MSDSGNSRTREQRSDTELTEPPPVSGVLNVPSVATASALSQNLYPSFSCLPSKLHGAGLQHS
jgi:hypothetical protein